MKFNEVDVMRKLIPFLLLCFVLGVSKRAGGADSCAGVTCGTIFGQQAACYIVNGAAECCSNGQCLSTDAPAPTPTPVGTPRPPEPTPAPTPGPDQEPPPPQVFSSWAASCPDDASVIDTQHGILYVDCPSFQVDCSSIPDRTIRAWELSPMMTWFLTYRAPRIFTGTITARFGGCFLQPQGNDWDHIEFLEPVGLGIVQTSCTFLSGDCRPIELLPFVGQELHWQSTDNYPESKNQLFAIVPGK